MISAGNTKSHFKKWLFSIYCIALLLLGGCESSLEHTQLSGATMGTTWHINYLPHENSATADDLQSGVEQLLVEVNQSMSTYLADSEILRINESPINGWFELSDGFAHVLEAALMVGGRSEGAYDVTVGPLVDLWGFGPARRELNAGVPDQALIKSRLQQVGQQYLEFDVAGQRLRKIAPVTLDFSSIAKGYAVDVVADYFSAQQIDNYLVEIGGEMRLSGQSARGDAWRVAIEQPEAYIRDIAQTLSLSDMAIATSGDYRNFFEHDGVRYSHSIDARTGYPAAHELVSVTVVHRSAMLADAWATALTVLGPEQAWRVAQDMQLAVYFIQREGAGYRARHTTHIEPYMTGALAMGE